MRSLNSKNDFYNIKKGNYFLNIKEIFMVKPKMLSVGLLFSIASNTEKYKYIYFQKYFEQIQREP
jgi:hypothetical protein